MKFRSHLLCCPLVLGFAFTIGIARTTTAGEPTDLPLKQGDAVTLGDHRAVVTRLDTLPYVESDYSKRFKFDSFDNPKLKELRERYHSGSNRRTRQN